eukprot:COSAG01_NODE_6284_length_3753_cov_4083.123974_3_plen_178_part_00
MARTTPQRRTAKLQASKLCSPLCAGTPAVLLPHARSTTVLHLSALSLPAVSLLCWLVPCAQSWPSPWPWPWRSPWPWPTVRPGMALPADEQNRFATPVSITCAASNGCLTGRSSHRFAPLGLSFVELAWSGRPQHQGHVEWCHHRQQPSRQAQSFPTQRLVFARHAATAVVWRYLAA